MKIVTLKDVPPHRLEADGVKGATKQVPIGVADGTPTMSLRVFTLEPGGHTPHHSHPWEHINYILSGQGVMIDNDGTHRPVTAGTYAMVAPNEMHQFRNTSDTEPFQFLCMVPREHE